MNLFHYLHRSVVRWILLLVGTGIVMAPVLCFAAVGHYTGHQPQHSGRSGPRFSQPGPSYNPPTLQATFTPAISLKITRVYLGGPLDQSEAGKRQRKTLSDLLQIDFDKDEIAVGAFTCRFGQNGGWYYIG